MGVLGNYGVAGLFGDDEAMGVSGDDGVAGFFGEDGALGFFGDEGVLGVFGLSNATFIVVDIYISYAPQGDALQQGTEVSHCIAVCF